MLEIGEIVLAIGLFIISAIAIVSAAPSSVEVPLLIVIATISVIAAVSFYVAGVIVSANGQVLKASIDCAVNGSPFIDEAQKAAIMSLPEVTINLPEDVVNVFLGSGENIEREVLEATALEGYRRGKLSRA